MKYITAHDSHTSATYIADHFKSIYKEHSRSFVGELEEYQNKRNEQMLFTGKDGNKVSQIQFDTTPHNPILKCIYWEFDIDCGDQIVPAGKLWTWGSQKPAKIGKVWRKWVWCVLYPKLWGNYPYKTWDNKGWKKILSRLLGVPIYKFEDLLTDKIASIIADACVYGTYTLSQNITDMYRGVTSKAYRSCYSIGQPDTGQYNLSVFSMMAIPRLGIAYTEGSNGEITSRRWFYVSRDRQYVAVCDKGYGTGGQCAEGIARALLTNLTGQAVDAVYKCGELIWEPSDDYYEVPFYSDQFSLYSIERKPKKIKYIITSNEMAYCPLSANPIDEQGCLPAILVCEKCGDFIGIEGVTSYCRDCAGNVLFS